MAVRKIYQACRLKKGGLFIRAYWRRGSYPKLAIFSSRCRRAASSDSRRRGCDVEASSRRTRLRASSRLSRSRRRWRCSGVRPATVDCGCRESARSFCSSTDLLSHPRAIHSVCHKGPHFARLLFWETRKSLAAADCGPRTDVRQRRRRHSRTRSKDSPRHGASKRHTWLAGTRDAARRYGAGEGSRIPANPIGRKHC